MNKITRKCPNCGAVMQANAKYCRKCHAKLDSGRVETLQGAETEASDKAARKLPWQKRTNDDALRNLPKPVRPAEEAQSNGPQSEGFFTPAYAGETAGKSHKNGASDGSPRPVSTARGVDGGQAAGGIKDKNLWQIIAVLAALLVVIVVAIVLVVRLNRPAEEIAEPSAPFTSPNVVNVSNGTNGEAPPAQNGTPTPSPTPSASPTPRPTNTPVPTPSATPAVSPTPGTTTVNGVTVTATSDTIYISGSTVNIRSGPTTSSQILGTESRGYQLQRTGITGSTSNDWSRVSYKGSVAYVSNSLISTNAQTASGTGTTSSSGGTSTGSSGGTSSSVTAASGTVTVSSASGANLRSGPGMGYSVVTAVANNTQLTRTGTAAGGWTQVSYNGQTLYVATSLLAGSSSSSSSGTTSSSGSGTVTGDGVRVRSGPGTDYSVIGYYNKGASVSITGTSGSWYQISYNGQTGYIAAQYVSKS